MIRVNRSLQVLSRCIPAGDVRACVGAGKKADFVCMNRHTGQMYWKAAFWPASSGGVLYSSTGVAENSVYVQASSLGINLTASLHAYTGDIQWLVPNSGPHSGSPFDSERRSLSRIFQSE
jgi:hypothetical protein